jgi:hypothetical protein
MSGVRNVVNAGEKGYNPSGPFFKGEVKCDDFEIHG